ncbi:oligosaccharide flippase family protein [Parabacteroides sp. FAFU027]|uniref:oligosaccharide flippase family protein n=1 Tax=Parabacteroides sp. FAFU027 TaxID=2922715 RepID=UPI001FAEBB32|nr:oligosaccharide flippase family protein [Parabacteroides sp. FAFU027]
MKNHKVKLNVISSASQVIIIGLVYFFLYKYLLTQLNIELLGVWSVVLATSSLANLANFGISSSVVRYVALYSTENDVEKIKKLVFTSGLFLLGLFTFLSAVIYPFAGFILKLAINEKHINIALSILPYSLICLITNAVAGVFSSVLDGLQKNYIRSLVFSASALFLLGTTILLTPRFGLKGVAMAQVAQSIFSLIGCLLLVIRTIKYNPFKWNWNKPIFKEIFSYGMKFQVISLFSMFNEPVTKALLAKFGGLAFTGYYEMANRLIMQVRGVIVNANQSLIPVLINKGKENHDHWLAFYKKTFYSVFMIALFIIGSVYLGSNVFSIIWIGHDEKAFSNIVTILSFSIFINLLCSPAYFSVLADGNLNILIKSQFWIAAINLVLGISFGLFYNGYGIVIAGFLSILFGTVYLTINFHKSKNTSLNYIISGTNIKLFTLMSCIIFTAKHFINGQLFTLQIQIGLVCLTLFIYTLVFFYSYILNRLPQNIVNAIPVFKSKKNAI